MFFNRFYEPKIDSMKATTSFDYFFKKNINDIWISLCNNRGMCNEVKEEL